MSKVKVGSLEAEILSLSNSHLKEFEEGYSFDILAFVVSKKPEEILGGLKSLERKGLVNINKEGTHYSLTKEGVNEVSSLDNKVDVRLRVFYRAHRK